MKPLVYVLILFIHALIPIPEQSASNGTAHSLAGRWEGTIEFGATRMPIALDFRKDRHETWTGRIIYTQFGDQAVPLKDLKVEHSDISFEVYAQPPFRFDGRMKGDIIEGPLVMAGTEGRLRVSRMPS